MKARAVEMRAQVEKTSEAPRYLSITALAEAIGVSTQQLNRWQRSGAVWVPRPAVLLGERGGWTRETADEWEPGAPSVAQPDPVRYRTQTEMCAAWHLTPELLWHGITEHTEPPAPDMWLVHGMKAAPGWLPR